MVWKKKSININMCPICGGRSFSPGPDNRMNNGVAPQCNQCSSLERHRIIYNCYQIIPKKILREKNCLHIAPDLSVNREWFKRYEGYVYGGNNSLDIQNLNISDESYDWVICNHGLEHVQNDVRAMNEMIRVTAPSGIVQFAISCPLHKAITDDWGFPDKSLHYHYRTYGADFLTRFKGILNEKNVLSAIGVDPITGDHDVLFFVSKDSTMLSYLRSILTGEKIPPILESLNNLESNFAEANKVSDSFKGTKKSFSFTNVALQEKSKAPDALSTKKICLPVMRISTKEELSNWYNIHHDFVKHRERMSGGFSEANFAENANLKLIQDLAICDFIRKYIRNNAKVLEIGGGNSRILSFFSEEIEGWNLDKFEGAGNGPTQLLTKHQFKQIYNNIGAFDENLPDNYFDMVFSISVVEHINDEDNVLKNILKDINRVLKPGGFNVHCIDCRFPTNREPDISNRRLAKYMIEQYGFRPETIYQTYKNDNIFMMSGAAYNKFWKKYCQNRSYEIDGLPFNIFLATQKEKEPQRGKKIRSSPKISVQVPIYNKQEYISACLDSILDQTFTDFEVICVDDHSTDNSFNILQHYSNKDSRIKIFRNERNMGTLFSRKRCLIEATGDYMVFVDADDIALPTMFQEFLKKAEISETDFLQCGAEILYDTANPQLTESDYESYNSYFSNVRECSLNEKIIENIYDPIKVNLWISMIKKDVYKAIVPYIPSERIQHGNDNLLIYLFSYFARTYTTVNKILYQYRVNPTSSNLTIPKIELVLEHIRSRARVLHHVKNIMCRINPNWDEKNEPFPRYAEKTFNYCITLMERSLKKYPGEYNKTIKCLGDAFGKEKAESYLSKKIYATNFDSNEYYHDPARFLFGSGWHAYESNGSEWWRWSKNSGIIHLKTVIEGKGKISFSVMSQHRHNDIQIKLNGMLIRTVGSNMTENKIGSIKVQLKRGTNILQFLSNELPITPSHDTRLLNFMVKNFKFSDPKKIIRRGKKSTFAALKQIQESGLFNTEYYQNQVPEPGLPSGEEHYLLYGAWEHKNPNPYFDSTYYLVNNNDVYLSGENPLLHYLSKGWKEGIDPHPAFNTSKYLTTYPDLKKAEINPLVHYLKYGVQHGCQLCP